MTVTQLTNRIHELYEGSNDYPGTSEEDYIIRLALLNNGVETWADEPQDWEEIFAEDTSETTTNGTNNYTVATDFRRPSKNTRLKIVFTSGTKYYNYVSRKKAKELLANGCSGNIYWFQGSSVYVSPTPDETGAVITIPYIKNPDTLSDTTDVPQLSRPLYLVYFVLSILYEQDSRNDMVTYYQNKAAEQMSYMIEEVGIDDLEIDGSESSGLGV